MCILLGLRFLCVSVRLSVCSSHILLARFVRSLIGRKGGREVSSLSLTHTHTHTQLGLVLEIFKKCSQYHTQNAPGRLHSVQKAHALTSHIYKVTCGVRLSVRRDIPRQNWTLTDSMKISRSMAESASNRFYLIYKVTIKLHSAQQVLKPRS
jgi:hypothetical protein